MFFTIIKFLFYNDEEGLIIINMKYKVNIMQFKSFILILLILIYSFAFPLNSIAFPLNSIDNIKLINLSIKSQSGAPLIGFPQDKLLFNYPFLLRAYLESNTLNYQQKNSIIQNKHNIFFNDINRHFLNSSFILFSNLCNIVNKIYKQISVLAIPIGGRAPPTTS